MSSVLSSPVTSNAPSIASDFGRPLSAHSATSNSSASTSLSSFYAAVATAPPRDQDFDFVSFDPSHDDQQGHVAVEPHDLAYASHVLPSTADLDKAGDMLFDADGNPRTFKSLYLGGDYGWDRRLIILIRHFFCRACKRYIDALRDELMTGPTPPSIIIVGCGSHELIRPYIIQTSCPFPIYVDESVKIFKTLGCRRWHGILPDKSSHYSGNASKAAIMMGSTGDFIKATFPAASNYPSSSDPRLAQDAGELARPESPHLHRSTPRLKSRVSSDALKGGPLWQVGGEFVFERGVPVWCHRMLGMRGHSEVQVLKRVLGLEEDMPKPNESEPPEYQYGKGDSGRKSSGQAQPTEWPQRKGSLTPIADVDESRPSTSSNSGRCRFGRLGSVTSRPPTRESRTACLLRPRSRRRDEDKENLARQLEGFQLADIGQRLPAKR